MYETNYHRASSVEEAANLMGTAAEENISPAA